MVGMRFAPSTEEMYRPTPTGFALRVRMMLLMFILLLITGCGAPEEVKPRPLPEVEKALRPGQYRSEEFKPSLSFRIGDGWANAPREASDHLALTWGRTWGLGFVNPQKVYKPTETGSPKLVEAPEDMVGWYRRHPYLRTSKPEPVTVGGVKGEQFDVLVAEDVPEDHFGVCGLNCVDLARFEQLDLALVHRYTPADLYAACGSDCVNPFRSSSGSLFSIREEEKLRLTVVENAKGKSVIMSFGGHSNQFEYHKAETQKVVNSVVWRNS